MVVSALPAFIVMQMHIGSALGKIHEHQACCQGLLYEGRGLLCVELHPCVRFCSASMVRALRAVLLQLQGYGKCSRRALLEQALQVGILPRQLQQHLVVKVLRHCNL